MANSNYAVSGAGNPPAAGNDEDFGGAGSQEMANGICSSLLSTCIFDIVHVLFCYDVILS